MSKKGAFIGVRHGETDAHGYWEAGGILQMAFLASDLKDYLEAHADELDPYLLYSPQPEVRMNGEVLAAALHIAEEHTVHNCCFTAGRQKEMLAEAQRLVDAYMAPGRLVIAMGELDVVAHLIEHEAKKLDVPCEKEGIGYCQGVLLSEEECRTVPR